MRRPARASWPRVHPLLVVLPAVFVALMFRDSGLYPSVFADEWAYSTSSRLVPLADATFPNFAYLAIYRATSACGDGFLACARILNAAVFLAAAPFIHLTARRVCTRWVATLVTVLTLVGPINTYTAYFMPEALYFLSFWVLAWFVLGLDATSDRRMWVVAGTLLGTAALVKPHALFLIPALLGYIAYVERPRIRTHWTSVVWSGALVIVAALTVKLAGGYLLAGSAGLTLFGATYSTLAEAALSDSPQARQLPAVLAKSLFGHLLVICLLFGVAVAGSAARSLRGLRAPGGPELVDRTAAFTVLTLVTLVLVVALFTASVSATGPVDYAARLHLRYYDFAFPLLLIVAGAQVEEGSPGSARRWRLVVALPIGAAIAFALLTGLGGYLPVLVDGPELRGFTASPRAFMALGGLSLAALVLWSLGSRWGARLFLYGFLPIAVIWSSATASTELRRHVEPDAVDRAGSFVKGYLPTDQLGRVVVVGSAPADLFRALFYLDDPRASLLEIPAGSSYDLASLPAGKDWALIIGDHAWTNGALSSSAVPGVILVRREEPGASCVCPGERVPALSIRARAAPAWAATRL